MLSRAVQHTPAAPITLNPKHAIVVHHMMRSGGHAILHWIAEHIADNLVFFDNLNPNSNIMDNRRTPWKLSVYRMPSTVIGNGRKWEWVYKQLNALSTQDIECFLYSFEDRHPSTICDEIKTEQKRVILMRDPYNWIASRLKGFQGIHPKEKYKVTDDPIGMWKIHAQCCINNTEGYIPILYNQWFTSQQYRIELSQRLGLEHTDKGLEYVPSSGGGSSFDGRNYHMSAQQMNVIDRWREYTNDEVFRSHIDKEMCDMSDILFPELSHVRKELNQ